MLSQDSTTQQASRALPAPRCSAQARPRSCTHIRCGPTSALIRIAVHTHCSSSASAHVSSVQQSRVFNLGSTAHLSSHQRPDILALKSSASYFSQAARQLAHPPRNPCGTLGLVGLASKQPYPTDLEGMWQGQAGRSAGRG